MTHQIPLLFCIKRTLIKKLLVKGLSKKCLCHFDRREKSFFSSFRFLSRFAPSK